MWLCVAICDLLVHGHDVSHQVALPVGGVAALRAPVRLLSRVNHGVTPQIGGVGEGFATVSAAEGFHPF